MSGKLKKEVGCSIFYAVENQLDKKFYKQVKHFVKYKYKDHNLSWCLRGNKDNNNIPSPESIPL